jgi:pimeloyl-ACP methyl ester carboxylesterase
MRPHSLVLVLILFALLLALAHRSPSARAQSAAPQALQWSACDDVPNAECAHLDVPLDPDQPNGRQLTLRLGRVRSTDPANSHGVLLLIPGGPGVGISGEFGEFRTLGHVDDLARQFDVVTWDPRGIGESSPVRCEPDAVPPVSTPSDNLPSTAEWQAMASANAAFIQSCFAASGDLMGYLSSMDTAADIERIRQALTPNDGLIAYAASYGTAYGQAYLERYGDHVKALVLDAVVDHSVDLTTFTERNILGVQDGFDRFAQWCAQDSTCPVQGQDIGAVFDAAIGFEPRVKIVVPQFLAGGQLIGWPLIAKILGAASSGDPTALNALLMTPPPTDPTIDEDVHSAQVDAGLNGLPLGVQCADYGPQADYAAYNASGAALAARAPRFAWKFWDSAPLAHSSAGLGDCAGWPKDVRYPPHPLQVGSHSNVLVASTAHDPPTPLINALSVWMQIPDAKLLIADADGHQSLVFSQCSFEAIAGFLSGPASAQATTLCPH